MKRTNIAFPQRGVRKYAPMIQSRQIGLHHYVNASYKSDGGEGDDDEDQEKAKKALLKNIEDLVTEKLKPAATKDEMKAAIEEAVKALTGATIKIGTGDAAKTVEEILREQGAEITKMIEAQKDGGNKPMSLLESITKQLEAQKEKLQDLSKNRNADRVVIEIKASNSTMTTGYTSSAPNAYLPVPMFMPGIHTSPEIAVTIMDLVDMGTSESQVITWVNEQPIEGDAGWTAEGALKAQVAWKYTVETSSAKKATAFVKVTTENLKDIPFMANRIYTRLRELILRKLQDGIINGDGTGDTPLGIVPQSPAYVTNSFDNSVTTPTTADALMAMAGQIDELEYDTDSLVAVMNGVDIRKMKWEKDANGNYIIPPFTTQNGTYVDNMRVVIEWLRPKASMAVKIVNVIKSFVESDTAGAIVAFTANKVDDVLLAKMRTYLPKIAFQLQVTEMILDSGTPDQVIASLIKYLKAQNKDVRVMFYVQLAAKLTEAFADGEIDNAEAIAISQMIFKELSTSNESK